jgi:CRISPR-associated protein Csd1
LERTPTRRHRQAVSLGSGDVLVYWTKEPHAIMDALPGLLDADPVAETVSAPWKGVRRTDVDGTAFYAAVLGTNRTRVIVRSWIETTAGDVRTNVARYLDDLAIDGDDQRPPTVGALLRAVDEPAGRLSPSVPGNTIRAILHGQPLPRELLVAALRRLLLPADRNDRWALRTRCALVKAILARTPNSGRHPSVSLNEQTTDVPYLLGRLFAVLERLQHQAHGAAVDSTVRDRYFRSAATTPAMVFPRLLTLSVYHASKLAGRGRGMFLEARKSEIMDLLPAQPLPTTMSLEAQGLFTIGYYHQRQRLFQRTEVLPNEAKRD